MLSLPRFGHFAARTRAAGKLAAPSGTLLDFLLRDRHPRGLCDQNNSIPIEHFNPGLKISISIKNFVHDRKFQSRGVSVHGALLVLQRRLYRKFQSTIERLKVSMPKAAIDFFSIPGPSRTAFLCSYDFDCRGSRGFSKKGPIYRSWPDLGYCLHQPVTIQSL